MKKTSTGENPNTIIFILLFLFLFGGWLFWPSGNSDTSQPAKVEQEADRQAEKEKKIIKNFVVKSRELNFLKKVDGPGRTYYLNGTMWRLINAGRKENVVTFLARDAGYFHSNVNQAVGITVKDWQSGKTIAEYSVFSGVSIK